MGVAPGGACSCRGPGMDVVALYSWLMLAPSSRLIPCPRLSALGEGLARRARFVMRGAGITPGRFEGALNFT